MVEDHADLPSITRPRLFVQGENDEFGPGEALRALVEPLPPPREIVVVPGTDHFFDGQLDALQGAVADWAERRPWAAPGAQSRRPRVEDGVSSASSSAAGPEPPPRGR